MEGKDMFIENESAFGFDETVEKLEQAIKAESWGLLHTHDLQGILNGKGFDVEPTKVFAICKPPFANKLLSNDDLKIFSSLMPCRVSVAQKENGKVYVSRMNFGTFASMIGGDVGDIMRDAYKEVENMLTEIIR